MYLNRKERNKPANIWRAWLTDKGKRFGGSAALDIFSKESQSLSKPQQKHLC